MHTDDDSCFKVYAMDLQDAYETLLENEPTIKLDDVQFVEEHKCASVAEAIH
jgi:hypothetical protein|tara:strand:+ start:468 stop:623 length:156 start_codon:yes stop_codon:yes gene_type:complete